MSTTAQPHRSDEEYLDKRFTVKSLAERLGVSPQTIYNWRVMGYGPKSFRAGGRRVLYRMEDVLAWEQEQLAKSA